MKGDIAEMTKWFMFLLCTLLFVSMAASVGASTSFFGPAGLLVMPTAETLGQGQCQLFANYIDRGSYQETPAGINLGLGHGIEAGVASVNETGLFAGAKTIVNLKWMALAETETRPALAVGAINAAGNQNFTGTLVITHEAGKIAPYFVASKKLAIPGCKMAVTGSAGYIGGNFNGIMLGADAKVTPKLNVMADWVNNYTNLSLGARYQATDSISVGANLINGDFAVGTTYALSLK